MASKAQAGLVAVAVTACAHLSGVLRAIEREASPRLAAASLDLFHVSPSLEPSIAAAKSFIINSSKGDKTPDYQAARAACAFLNAYQNQTPQHAQLTSLINDYLSPSDRNVPGVQYAVDKVANTLQGITGPSSYAHLYMQACYRRY